MEKTDISPQEKQMLSKWKEASLSLQKAPSPIAVPFLWEGQDKETPHLKACADTAPSWQNLLYKSLSPQIPAREKLQSVLNQLNQLRIMFSIYEGSLYLEFLQVPLPNIRNMITQIHIGHHTFSLKDMDDQGGICLGKISSTSPSGEEVIHFKPQDLDNIRLEIRIDGA